MNDTYLAMDEAALQGFAQIQARRNGQHLTRVASATALWSDVINGRAPIYYIQEALAPRSFAVARAIDGQYPGVFRRDQFREGITQSDFSLLTGEVIDRMALGRYREWPSPWRRFFRTSTNLRDFREVQRVAVDGLEGAWPKQPEQTELKYGSLGEGEYRYQPAKYALGVKLSFEAIMNDDLDQFMQIPDRLGRGGARSVGRFATGLWIDANGPHASFFTVGNGNIITGNPALSITSLGTAMTQLMSMKDTEGEPLMVEGFVLAVAPKLWVTANNIVNQLSVDVTEGGGTSARIVRVNNWLVNNLEVVMDPYIPLVASNANGDTTWALFANPTLGRPALEIGFVRGFQEPQIFQKVADTMRVGGGIAQEMGSFGTMSQEYKGVVAYGGRTLDPKSAVASNGSGV